MADDAPSTALTVQQPRALRTPVEDLVPVFDTNRFEHYGRIATVMARASLVPDSLKGSSFDEAQANCFQVAELADRWGYSPFAVAQCASIVYGKLMVEGKLVAAVLASKLGIELNHYYTGEWGKDDYRIFVTDSVLSDEQIQALKPHVKFSDIRIIDGSVGEWKTLEKDKSTKGNWKNQPDVQLQYRGDRTWARLFQPAIMLGVVTDDEIEAFAGRQESRRPSLAAGPDAAALESARASLVAPITEEPQPPAVVEPPTEEPKPQDQPQVDDPKPRDPDVPHPAGDAEDASKSSAPADEVYLLAGDAPGEDGKRQTYKNAKPFSRASEKASKQLKVYDQHAPEVAAAEIRPTETASVQTAEATPATSASADLASDASPDLKDSGLESSASGSESSTEAIFSDIDDPNAGEEAEELNPMLAAMTELDGANSGREIKDIMGRVTATDAFKGADETGKALVRKAAWDRYCTLHNKGIEDGRVTLDVMFMSLYIEFGATTKTQIDQMWNSFFQGEVYKGLNDGWKRALAALIAKRKAVLP